MICYTEMLTGSDWNSFLSSGKSFLSYGKSLFYSTILKIDSYMNHFDFCRYTTSCVMCPSTYGDDSQVHEVPKMGSQMVGRLIGVCAPSWDRTHQKLTSYSARVQPLPRNITILLPSSAPSPSSNPTGGLRLALSSLNPSRPHPPPPPPPHPWKYFASQLFGNNDSIQDN